MQLLPSRKTKALTTTEAVDQSTALTARTTELPELPVIHRLRVRPLDPADVATKIESAIVALEHAAQRTEQVAGGRKQAYAKLHCRLRQSMAPFADLRASDVRSLSPGERWSFGLRLGAELEKLLTAFPKAIEALEAGGKSQKATDLHDALQRVLETLAHGLEPVPIVAPELAKLLGDPPRIDADNAPAIVEKLKRDLAPQTDDHATPEQRLAALFLNDGLADELRAALVSRGADPSPVADLVDAGRSRRQRISQALRKGAVVAATLALTVPALVNGMARDAPAEQRDVVAAAAASQPAPVEPAPPIPTVDPAAVHDPISIRTAEAPNQRERARAITQLELERAAERAAEGEPSTDPAGVPLGVPRDTIVEYLKAAGFPVQSFADAAGEEIHPLAQAVATFQASVGLEETGIVTPETFARLDDSIIIADPGNVAFSPPQALGEHSGAVRQSEEVMAELGLIPRERVDGEFDQVTQRGSETFEDRHPGLGQDGAIEMEQFRAMVRELIGKYTAKPDVVSMPSPNQSSRGGVDIDAIVLHHTASNSVESDLATLRSPAAEVSANFLIGRDGTIYELVPEENAAWHAGEALLHGRSDVNARSIGIEITNDGLGQTPFTPEQYRALRQLVPYLVAKYDIPIENIVGHKEVAIPAGRKADPAPNFDEAHVVEAVHRVEQLQKLA
jgi:N-acetylmuramoyl-L-alanine amidase